jgi:hypothetical protein
MAWAYARQAQLSEETCDRNKSALTALKTGKLAVRTASFFDMGEKLLHRLFREIAEADLRVQQDLTECRPQDMYVKRASSYLNGHFFFTHIST